MVTNAPYIIFEGAFPALVTELELFMAFVVFAVTVLAVAAMVTANIRPQPKPVRIRRRTDPRDHR